MRPTWRASLSIRGRAIAPSSHPLGVHEYAFGVRSWGADLGRVRSLGVFRQLGRALSPREFACRVRRLSSLTFALALLQAPSSPMSGAILRRRDAGSSARLLLVAKSLDRRPAAHSARIRRLHAKLHLSIGAFSFAALARRLIGVA